MSVLRAPTLLDLDDDVLCQILRTAYGVSANDLPGLQLGVGAKSELSLLSAAQTCHRLRHIVLHTLPTTLTARFKPIVRPGLSAGIQSRLGRGKDKSVVEPRPHDFTSATVMDIGSNQKPSGHLRWSSSENSLEHRCLNAAAVSVETATFDALVSFQHLRSLDVVGCKFTSGPGALARIAQMQGLRQLCFTIHVGVSQSALALLAQLSNLEFLGLLAENSPIINVALMADTFRSLQTLEALTIDCSRGLSEAALTALPYLTRLTSLDIMHSNPDLDIFARKSMYSNTPPPRSVPARPAPRVTPPATLQRQSMNARASLDRGTDPRAPLFSSSTSRPGTACPAFTPNDPVLGGTGDGSIVAPGVPAVDPISALPPLPTQPPFPSLLQLRLSHLINSSVDSIRAFLERFPSLQCLELMHCEQATRASLAPISGMTGLRRLRLTACPRAESLPSRGALPPLQEIDLTACGARNEALEAIAGCNEVHPGPQLLRLYNCRALTAANLAQEIDVSHLRGLSLAFCTGMIADDLTALAPHLTALEELSLEGCVHLGGAEALTVARGLPQLLLLDVTSIRVQDGHLPLLLPLTQLRALRMRRQVAASAVAKMADESAAPVWRALQACPQAMRWMVDAGGPWAPFLSRGWKIPEL